MIDFLFVILQIILLIILLGTTTLFLLWIIGNLRNRVPFVMASRGVMEDVCKALQIKDDSVVYDLGCGDGRILFYLSSQNKKAKYIGIENNILAVMLAKLGSILNQKKTNNKVKIINGNFFKHDLSEASHIFVYLYPNMMDDLLLKFDRELKKGTRLVSLSFQFTNKRPIAEIDLNRSKYKLGRKLYIYNF